MSLTIQEMDEAKADLDFIETYKNSTADQETSRLGALVDTPIGRLKQGGYTELTPNAEWAQGVQVDNYNVFIRYLGDTYVPRFDAVLPFTTGTEPDPALWDVAASDQLIGRYNDTYLSGYVAINFDTIAEMQALTSPTLLDMSVNVGDVLTVPIDPNSDHRATMAFRVDSTGYASENYALANGLFANRIEYAEKPAPEDEKAHVEFVANDENFNTIHGAVISDNLLIIRKENNNISLVDSDLNHASADSYGPTVTGTGDYVKPVLIRPGVMFSMAAWDFFGYQIETELLDLRTVDHTNFETYMQSPNRRAESAPLPNVSGSDVYELFSTMNTQLLPSGNAIIFYRNVTQGQTVAVTATIRSFGADFYDVNQIVFNPIAEPQPVGYTSATIGGPKQIYLAPKNGGRFVRFDIDTGTLHIISSADPVQGSPFPLNGEVYNKPVLGKDGNIYLIPKHANQPGDVLIGRIDVALNSFDPNYMAIPSIYSEQADFGPSYHTAGLGPDGKCYCIRPGTLGANLIRIDLENKTVEEVEIPGLDSSLFTGIFTLDESTLLISCPQGVAYVKPGADGLQWTKSAYISNR